MIEGLRPPLQKILNRLYKQFNRIRGFDGLDEYEEMKAEYFPDMTSEEVDLLVWDYFCEINWDEWTNTPDGPLENEE